MLVLGEPEDILRGLLVGFALVAEASVVGEELQSCITIDRELLTTLRAH
jgi:hypothetical protein